MHGVEWGISGELQETTREVSAASNDSRAARDTHTSVTLALFLLFSGEQMTGILLKIETVYPSSTGAKERI